MSHSILVLEADNGTRERIVTLLSARGYHCTAFADRREFASRVDPSGEHPDLLIVDCDAGMPDDDYAGAVVYLVSPDRSDGPLPPPSPRVFGYVQKTAAFDAVLPVTVETALIRQRTEDQARQEEQSYRFFFDNIPIAAIVSDPDYTVQQWNNGAEELFGYTRDEVVEKNLISCLSSDRNNLTPDQLRENLRKILAINHKSRNINFDRTRDDRHILCEWHDFPYRKDGRDLILSVARDVTKDQELLKTLQTTIEQKDFLMQEIYHRLKNNLNMIVSLIRLKVGELEAREDRTIQGLETAIDALQDIRRKISTFSVLYDMLHQHGGSDRFLDVGAYLEELIATIFDSMSDQACRIDCKMDVLPVAPQKAVVFGLITNEIATNALKHGFVQGGDRRFSVTLRVLPDKTCEYTLENSGGPFPEALDLDTSASLGLQLIQSLVEQLNGTVTLRKVPSARYTIRCPLED